MSLGTTAVIDTCLLINWAHFSEKDILKKLFQRLFIPEKTYPEIKTIVATRVAAQWMTKRFLIITPVLTKDENEVVKVLDVAARYPELPTLDLPELYAFVLAKRLKIPLLTDNKAPKRLAEVTTEYSDVTVYDSLDLLKLTFHGEVLIEKVKRFMQDTSFFFSKHKLGEIGFNEK